MAAAPRTHYFGTLKMQIGRQLENIQPHSSGDITSKVDAYTPTADQLKEQDVLKVRRAWQLAMSPFQSSVLMTGIMLYMAGSTLNIWSIMMTFFALSSPISAISGTERAFEGFRSSSTKQRMSLPLQKAVYILLHLVALSIGMWKLRTLGLLPTQWSDVYGFMQTRTPLQYAAAPIDL
eukprot:c881_g1_i1.p1 GENE.c881_g1_i1~~c881_g1_i1.p1  ORF type:complete len:178 (+),score=28.66 c881_g1_i1:125-658(+)